MKRHGNLWEKIIDYDNLIIAHRNARRGKLYYTEVKEVDAFEDEFIKYLQYLLVSKKFNTSPYEISERFDGRKTRTIYKLPYYPDRIVQHALLQVCEPIWKPTFIRDTFQSITGRGTHDARKRVEKAIKNKPPQYALKFDINKYYPSVNNEKLKQICREKIKCKDTLWLIDNIIDSNEGLPIGNYTSQYFGNLYLRSFDWWVKQELKPNSYFRYCDDIVLLGNSAEELHNLKDLCFKKLSEEYNLSIKKDWQVFPVDVRRLDFVGFVFKSDSTRLRKTIAFNIKQKSKQICKSSHTMTPFETVNSIGSYWGWCKYANAKKYWYTNVGTKTLKIVNDQKELVKELQRCA